MNTFKNELTLRDFKLLFETLYPRLCVFANKYLKDLETAKSLVQEVFIKVWEHEMTFQDKTQITNYFYKVVKHKCMHALNSNHSNLTTGYKPEDINIRDIQTFLKINDVTSKTTAILEQVMGKLPYKAAQVIRLSLQDFTNKEIAKQLNISVNAVKDHKKIAYQKLKVFLSGLAVD